MDATHVASISCIVLIQALALIANYYQPSLTDLVITAAAPVSLAFKDNCHGGVI